MTDMQDEVSAGAVIAYAAGGGSLFYAAFFYAMAADGLQAIALPAGALLLVVGRLLARQHRQQLQVQAVRARLSRSTRTVWRTTVQLNDGTQMRFDSTFMLAAGDFVEADAAGLIQPANLLGNQRVIGVVVSVEPQL